MSRNFPKNCLLGRYGFRQADVMVLFGGSILCGGDVLVHAMKEHAARKYIIVGGAGHTTETLRQRVHNGFPSIVTDGMPEAEIFKENLLSYSSDIYGMWEMDRYINLLMGEIPRLTDDKNGYGPAGKDFIAHIDMPDKVLHAFHELKKVLSMVRHALSHVLFKKKQMSHFLL